MKQEFVQAFALVLATAGSAHTLAQQPVADPSQSLRPRVAVSGPVAQIAQAPATNQFTDEDAAILPYYNRFMETYLLGPEDVITVVVFGQERYSRANITVPPNGRMSYPLIPEGVFVANKTAEQVAAEITKKLDEYIIDPKVSVILDKAVSARYSVLGDVKSPGVKQMTSRVSIYDAIAEAGGVLETGDKSRIAILRYNPSGNLQVAKLVNLKEIEKGRAAEVPVLVPGDQVLVLGNRLKSLDRILKYIPVLGMARMMSGM